MYIIDIILSPLPKQSPNLRDCRREIVLQTQNFWSNIESVGRIKHFKNGCQYQCQWSRLKYRLIDTGLEGV